MTKEKNYHGSGNIDQNILRVKKELERIAVSNPDIDPGYYRTLFTQQETTSAMLPDYERQAPQTVSSAKTELTSTTEKSSRRKKNTNPKRTFRNTFVSQREIKDLPDSIEFDQKDFGLKITYMIFSVPAKVFSNEERPSNEALQFLKRHLPPGITLESIGVTSNEEAGDKMILLVSNTLGNIATALREKRGITETQKSIVSRWNTSFNNKEQFKNRPLSVVRARFGIQEPEPTSSQEQKSK